MTSNNAPKVLIVEDHPKLARLTAELVGDCHCDVVGPVHGCEDTFRVAHETPPDVALIDLSLPDGSGMGIARRLHADGVRCAVVTAYPMSDRAMDAPEGVAWFEKPLSHEQFKQSVADLLQKV